MMLLMMVAVVIGNNINKTHFVVVVVVDVSMNREENVKSKMFVGGKVIFYSICTPCVCVCVNANKCSRNYYILQNVNTSKVINFHCTFCEFRECFERLVDVCCCCSCCVESKKKKKYEKLSFGEQ